MERTKICPRCDSEFLCRNVNIIECDCIQVSLDSDDFRFIGMHYDDCLCVDYLIAFKQEQQLLQEAADPERNTIIT